MREACHRPLAPHHGPEVLDHSAPTLVENATLLGLAAIEGDRLCVLAQTHKAIPELAFKALVRAVKAHQRV
jgi:hypothetical protein